MTDDIQSITDVYRTAVGVSDRAVERASENPRFSPEVRARLKVSTQNAFANIKVIEERIGHARQSIGKRLNALFHSRDPLWIRLRNLYALADEMNAFNGGNVACRKGCAHCCHIPVAMLEPEAQMLGMAIGRKPKKVARERSQESYDSQPYGYHTPCPFLKENECSIYANRPLACRTLVNADIDDLLCQLTEPPGPPVPYLDKAEIDMVGVAICAGKGGSFKSADIREYFPKDC